MRVVYSRRFIQVDDGENVGRNPSPFIHLSKVPGPFSDNSDEETRRRKLWSVQRDARDWDMLFLAWNRRENNRCSQNERKGIRNQGLTNLAIRQ